MNIEEIDRISYLVNGSFYGLLSDEEQYELDTWLKLSDDNRLWYDNFMKSTNISRKYREKNECNIEESLSLFKLRCAKKRHAKQLIFAFISAASVCILVVVSVFLLKINLKNSTEIITVKEPKGAILNYGNGKIVELASENLDSTLSISGITNNANVKTISYSSSTISTNVPIIHKIEVPTSGEYSIVLQDGTSVVLNSESSLCYPVSFNGDVREVTLEGEGFFDVAPDSVHPFIVHISDISVNVLGTKFDVKRFEEDDFVLAVESGKVQVTVKDNNCINVEKDEVCFVSKNGEIQKRNADITPYIAWRAGRFVFDNETVEDIMKTMSRWYGTTVFYTNEKAKYIRFTGNIKRYDSFNKIVEMLEMTKSVSVTIKNKNVIIGDYYK